MVVPTRDVGLGTAYERRAVYRLIARWCGRPAPATALEGPIDGMAGIPGLHLLGLAGLGTRVTVAVADATAAEAVREVYERAGLGERLELVVDDEPPQRRFELVVTFNALPLVRDWRAYLREQVARALRHVIVVVTNRGSYGALIRRGLRFARRRESGRELFDHESTDPRLLRQALSGLGRVRDETYVDCPWWPDLFVPVGTTLWRAAVGASAPAPDAGLTYDARSFPHAREPLPRQLRDALARHPSLEDRGPYLGRLFGHHRAWLVER